MGTKKSSHDLNKAHSPTASKSRRKAAAVAATSAGIAIKSGLSDSHNAPASAHLSNTSGHSATSHAPVAANHSHSHSHNHNQAQHHNQQVMHQANQHHKPRDEQYHHQQQQQHQQHQQNLALHHQHQSISSGISSKPKLLRSKPNLTKDTLEIAAPSWFDYILLIFYLLALYSFYALFWFVMWSIYLSTQPASKPRFKHPSVIDTARIKGISRSDVEFLCDNPM